MDKDIFATRLKNARLKLNVAVPTLAKAVNMNKATLYRYENGEINSIKEDKLEAIAEYLLVDKDYLTGKTDDEYNIQVLENLTRKHNVELNTVIHLTKELVKNDNVTLDGKPVHNDSLDYLIDTMELALEMLKRKNK